jgi:two-component system, OmpR family, phosphate regulon response regulator PhoB
MLAPAPVVRSQPGDRPVPAEGPVLVIDDEALLRLLLRDDLEAEGFKVVTAGNGPEALELAAQATPALIILDLNLGTYRGETIARLLNERRGRRIPIVVISIDARIRERTSDLPGVVAYLKKPFDLTDLRTIVRALVRRPEDPPTASSPWIS